MAIALKRVARSLWQFHWWRCGTSGCSLCGVQGIWLSCLMGHSFEEGCNACLLTSMELVCLGSGTFLSKMLPRLYMLATHCLGDSYIAGPLWVSMY